MGSGTTRLCDGDISWLLWNGGAGVVGTVELVCVSGRLRMGGESLLLPVWSLLELGSLASQTHLSCQPSGWIGYSPGLW